jgi:hypothetical protein
MSQSQARSSHSASLSWSTEGAPGQCVIHQLTMQCIVVLSRSPWLQTPEPALQKLRSEAQCSGDVSDFVANFGTSAPGPVFSSPGWGPAAALTSARNRAPSRAGRF